ncbi:MAG: FMN-binding protein [Melioribacteraceae bacterium]|nr:FMN-binding protein [Melioribacteraceae bacterium]
MNTVIKMIVTLSFIGIVSGSMLSQIAGWAAPKIEMHRKADTEKAIFLVQPEAKSYSNIGSVDFECYKVFIDSVNQKFIGYALPYEGNGFQGKVRLMVGIDSSLKIITGLQVLEQVETPGLGTKVTEEAFTGQFNGLLSVPQVNWVKGVPPEKNNEIQAITGATISSKAVVNIINDGLKKLRRSVQSGGGE